MRKEVLKLALEALTATMATHGFQKYIDQTKDDAITALREALAEQPAQPHEMTPEMMRKVQMHSELGAYAAANLAGAYDLFSEFWRVAMSAAPQPARPQQEPVAYFETITGRIAVRDDTHRRKFPMCYRPLVFGDTSPPAQQEPVAWISVKDALPKAVQGVSYNAGLTDVVLVRHSDRPDYPITAHAVVGEGLGAGVAIPTEGASEHPEIAWYSAFSNLNNPFNLKNDDYERYLPKIFGSKITHWKPIDTSPPAQQEPVAWVCYGAPGKQDIDFEEADINRLPIGTQLYTSPPQRTWVGLTDEEITDIWAESSPYYHEDDFARTIEAKLKEKNQCK